MVSIAPKLLTPPPTPSSSSPPNITAGRRSLLYLLVPRTTRHFTPALIATISETDAIVATTSKKDVEVRRREVKAGASSGSGGLVKFVEERAEELLIKGDPAWSLFVGEVMLNADGGEVS